MRADRPLRGALAAAALLSLAGCVRFDGIDHQEVVQEVPAAIADPTFDAWPAAAWWTDYRDPALTELVEHALADNPDVRHAEARVRAAQAVVGFVGANRRPRLDAGFDSTWQRYSEKGVMPDDLGGSHEADSRLALDLSYELDLFGRNRAMRESTAALSQVDVLNVAVAQLAVASSVARLYFQLARAGAERDVIAATIAQRKRILELVRARVALGLDSNVELLQAEGAIPHVQAELAQLDEQISLLRNALSRVSLVPFERTATLSPHLPAIAAPTLPATIPADLVGRRADIQASKWRIRSLLHGIESVRAEFYPSVNLAAFAGFSALGLGALLESGAAIYGVGPALSLPIFDADRLRSKLKFVNAQTDMAIVTYHATLLDAMQEVVRAVTSIRALARRSEAQQRARQAAEKAYAIALQRFEAGLTGYLTVLATEGDVLRERRATALLAARALDLDVALKRALGGGIDSPVPGAALSLHTGNRP